MALGLVGSRGANRCVVVGARDGGHPRGALRARRGLAAYRDGAKARRRDRCRSRLGCRGLPVWWQVVYTVPDDCWEFHVSTLVAWAVFLLAQNASFTFVSRARNSGSYTLHAIAAVCSNGIWMAAQFVSLGLIIDTIKTGAWQDKLFVRMFYTVFTVTGSVFMHWFGVNFIETGKRKVGREQ